MVAEPDWLGSRSCHQGSILPSLLETVVTRIETKTTDWALQLIAIYSGGATLPFYFYLLPLSKFLPFTVDPFSKDFLLQERKQEVAKVVILCKCQKKKNKSWCFMWFLCLAKESHEKLSLIIFSVRKNSRLSSAAFMICALRVKAL